MVVDPTPHPVVTTLKMWTSNRTISSNIL